jgi:hypothetical protein
LTNETIGVAIDNQSWEKIAFGVDDSVGVSRCSKVPFPESLSGGEPTREELTVDLFFLPGKQAQADLRSWIVKPAGEPSLFAIKDIRHSDVILGPFDSLDGAGKYPRMAVLHRALPALFQVDTLHGEYYRREIA